MTILSLAFRSWADRPIGVFMKRPEDAPARELAVRSQGSHKTVSAPRPLRPEMRWRLDANGRLTCSWHVISAVEPACSDDEETMPPSCRPPSWRRPFLALTPALPIRARAAAAA